jgi:perosamine synthetase
MTNICAAIGLAQLEQIDTFLIRKREIADLYNKLFDKSSFEFHQESKDVFHSYWMCSILVDKATQRDYLRQHLAKHGIETRPLFYPVHTMPMYALKYQCHSVAENLGWRGLNLPSYPDLSNDNINYIVSLIKDSRENLEKLRVDLEKQIEKFQNNFPNPA